jgi:hypothetical protein
MTSAPPLSEESVSKGNILVSVRLAIRDLWSDEGWRDVVGRLPSDAAATVTGADLTALAWYPTRYLLDCERAVFEGVAGRDEAAFRRYIARSTDLGFGRIRRTFLRFATPDLLARRASELWRHDHSAGQLTIEERGERHARLALRGHPFVHTHLSRIAFAEALRHIMSLSRIRNVRATHELAGDALVVSLAWGSG